MINLYSESNKWFTVKCSD